MHLKHLSCSLICGSETNATSSFVVVVIVVFFFLQAARTAGSSGEFDGIPIYCYSLSSIGLDYGKNENAVQYSHSSGSDRSEVAYKPLAGGPNQNTKEPEVSRLIWIDIRKLKVLTEVSLQATILENIYWKELGLLVFVWAAFLVLQIAKVLSFLNLLNH